MTNGFELGPIRPPSEASSVLLRITRNCPWNKCAFCPVYKKKKFSFRSIDEIKSDIDLISDISNKIDSIEGYDSGNIKFNDLRFTIPDEFVKKVMFWKTYGMKSLFLQDADSMVMKTPALVEILTYIKEKLPTVECITTYARSKSISRKTYDELALLKNSGLTRIHIGMESGSDEILRILKKGVTAQEHIDAGQKAVKSGLEVSEYFMPGAGGDKLSDENAIETARVINLINPTYIRIRSTVPIPGTPLYEMMMNKEWFPVSEEGKIREIKLFVENLHGITSLLQSDHIMNLIEEVNGEFPADKEKMINILDSFLNMPVDGKESFIVARRTGRVRFLSDFIITPEIISIKKYLKENYESIDDAVSEILRNYI